MNLFIWSLNFLHMCEKLTKSAKFSHLLIIFHNKFWKKCEKFAKGVKISQFLLIFHTCAKNSNFRWIGSIISYWLGLSIEAKRGLNIRYYFKKLWKW